MYYVARNLRYQKEFTTVKGKCMMLILQTYLNKSGCTCSLMRLYIDIHDQCTWGTFLLLLKYYFGIKHLGWLAFFGINLFKMLSVYLVIWRQVLDWRWHRSCDCDSSPVLLDACKANRTRQVGTAGCTAQLLVSTH